VSGAGSGSLAAAAADDALFAESVRQDRVHVKPAAAPAAIEGPTRGETVVDYDHAARKRQPMNVSLAIDHTASPFAIVAPGENQAAMVKGPVRQSRIGGAAMGPAEGGCYRLRPVTVWMHSMA
jgi:hypothetical protein